MCVIKIIFNYEFFFTSESIPFCLLTSVGLVKLCMCVCVCVCQSMDLRWAVVDGQWTSTIRNMRDTSCQATEVSDRQ